MSKRTILYVEARSRVSGCQNWRATAWEHAVGQGAQLVVMIDGGMIDDPGKRLVCDVAHDLVFESDTDRDVDRYIMESGADRIAFVTHDALDIFDVVPACPTGATAAA